MKRIILAILPIILAAQIPLNTTTLVPSEWKKTLDFGVKWTSLLVNSFSAVADDNAEDESIPEGVVTTTVAMAAIPDTVDFELAIERRLCLTQVEIQQRAKAIEKMQKSFNKRFRALEIRVKTI